MFSRIQQVARGYSTTPTPDASKKPSKLDMYARYGSTATITYLAVSWSLSLLIYVGLHVGSSRNLIAIDPLKNRIEEFSDKYFGLKIDANAKPLNLPIPMDPTLIGMTLIISKAFVPLKIGLVGWLTPKLVRKAPQIVESRLKK